MFQKQKWDFEKEIESPSQIPADPITADLKTHANTLSIWKVNDFTIEEINKSVLALALGRDSITRLDIFKIDEKEIEKNKMYVKNTPENGYTPLEGYEENHFDIMDLTLNNLGDMGIMILEKVKSADMCIRYTKRQISELLDSAFHNELFQIDDLNLKLQKEMKKMLNRKYKDKYNFEVE